MSLCVGVPKALNIESGLKATLSKHVFVHLVLVSMFVSTVLRMDALFTLVAFGISIMCI